MYEFVLNKKMDFLNRRIKRNELKIKRYTKNQKNKLKKLNEKHLKLKLKKYQLQTDKDILRMKRMNEYGL